MNGDTVTTVREALGIPDEWATVGLSIHSCIDEPNKVSVTFERPLTPEEAVNVDRIMRDGWAHE